MLDLYAQAHRTPLGELQGIVHQVADHLAEPHRVGIYLRQARIDESRKIEALLARALGEQAGHVLCQHVDVDRKAFELELARLDLGEVENVVDDGEQALARPRDHVGEALLAARQLRLHEEIGHHHDAIHRRADFVAHRREEVRLRPVRGFGGVARDTQVGGSGLDLVLEVAGMRLEPLVALADVAEHAVEPVDQLADLAVARLLDRDVVALFLADPRHRAQQRAQRTGDAMLETPGDEQPDEQRGAAADGGESCGRNELRLQLRQAADQHEPTDLHAALDDRNRDLDRVGAQHAPERDLLLAGERDVVDQPLDRAEGRECPSIGRTYLRVADIPDMGHAAQRRECGCLILRRRRERCGRAEYLGGRDQRLAAGIDVTARLLPQGDGGGDEGRDRDGCSDEHHQLALQTPSPLHGPFPRRLP